MKVTGIIAEYNPLHLGHELHIDRALKETGADHIISAMSGDYVQRGCPAVISKYERARSALLSGAGLVLELPLYYSTGSLEYFSMGAVSLLMNTGMVDCISFGSECGDIDMLKKAASLTSALSKAGSDKLKELLSSGVSYSNAINAVCDLPDDISKLLKTPNNLLAVSYIRAAGALGFNGGFHTVKREGAAYHDDSAGALSSSSIRKELLEGSDMSGLKDRMSKEVYGSLEGYLSENPLISEDDLTLLLYYKIRSLIEGSDNNSRAVSSLKCFLDVTDNLAGKIINEFSHAQSYSDLCLKLKSKDLNYARISRALLHILLDIRKDRMDEYRDAGYNLYIKPLGFRKDSDKLMHELKLHSSLPIISKNADAETVLSGMSLRMFNEGICADDLYEKTACIKCGRPFISEYERSMILI